MWRNKFWNNKWRFLRYIIVIFIIVITISAFLNHRTVNCRTKELLTNIDANVHTIKVSISEISEQHYNKILNGDTIYNSQQLDCLQHNMNESAESANRCIGEIKELCQYTFDANTITFIISALFVTMISFIMGYTKDIDRQIEKTKNSVKSNYRMDLYYARISNIHSSSMLGYYVLSSNTYSITSEFINIIYKMNRELSSLLRSIKGKENRDLKLYKSDNKQIMEILDDIKNNINLDEIKKHNSGGYGTTEILMVNLEELERVIADIEEIQES